MIARSETGDEFEVSKALIWSGDVVEQHLCMTP